MNKPLTFKMTYEVKTLEDLPKLKEIMEAVGMNPNFTKIAKALNCDRRTAKKYYDGKIPTGKRKRPSPVDAYDAVIKELLSDETPQVFHYKSILWRYLKDNHGLNCAESTFRGYISRREEFQDYFDQRSNKKTKAKASIRFETDPGEQAQIDWKENIDYLTSEGNHIKVNVLVMVLAYSRFELYALTQNKIQSVLISCLTDFFEMIGGVPRILLGDNMKTIMDESRTQYKKGIVNNKFYQFSKDMGFKVRTCIAKRPQTKGKVETQMKILDEIDAYQGQLAYSGLHEQVKKINIRKNMTVHQGTGKIPLNLFEQEKEFLLALPGQRIRTQYKIPQQQAQVNALNMISYKSKQYSVPLGYQKQPLFLEVIEEKLYIYDTTKLIAIHAIQDQKLNYLPEHYEEHLKEVMPYKDNIREFAQKNLKKIGGYFHADKTVK